MKDDFVKSLEIPEEELVKVVGSAPAKSKARKKKDEFCMFPFRVVTDIAKAGRPAGAVVGVLTALYELWFRGNHYNPVRLTSASLRKYRVTPNQKFRALKFLEKSGWIWIDRTNGKNPWVRLRWLDIKPPPGF
jgi:hypothetical protein